jgi:hypothetical protein
MAQAVAIGKSKVIQQASRTPSAQVSSEVLPFGAFAASVHRLNDRMFQAFPLCLAMLSAAATSPRYSWTVKVSLDGSFFFVALKG